MCFPWKTPQQMAFEAIACHPQRVKFKWEQKEPKNGILSKPHFQGKWSKRTKAKGLTEWPEQFLKIRSMVSQKSRFQSTKENVTDIMWNEAFTIRGH